VQGRPPSRPAQRRTRPRPRAARISRYTLSRRSRLHRATGPQGDRGPVHAPLTGGPAAPSRVGEVLGRPWTFSLAEMAAGTRPPIPPSYYRRSLRSVPSGTRSGLPLWRRLPWVRTRTGRRTVAALGAASALLALVFGLAALAGTGERSAPPAPPFAADTPPHQMPASPSPAQAAAVDQLSPTPAATARLVATPAWAVQASRAPAASEAASAGAASSDPGGSGTGRSGVPPGLSRHQRGQLPSPPQ
jgi:hypothetical protein